MFTIAVIGRPNVGKSTLFNCIAGKQLAIVLDKKIQSAPRINGRITDSGIITGGPTGFAPQAAQDLALRLQAQGLTPEQWLAITGKSSEELTAELREAAETSAKVDLALRAVADAEDLECTDDDLDAELAGVAERVGESVATVRAEFERGGNLSAVRSDVRKRKALEWLLERVEIVDEDGQAIDRAELELTPEDVSPAPSDAAETDDTETDETESDAT